MSKRNVTLPETNTGDLLTEVTRAFMQGACPSAVIARVMAGMFQAAAEIENADDSAFTHEVGVLLDTLHKEVRAMEDAHYGAGSKS
jgi:hypothetical protein